MRIVTATLALSLVASIGASGAWAQELPCQQVRLIVPYPAGGATDVAARLVAERLEPALKKQGHWKEGAPSPQASGQR